MISVFVGLDLNVAHVRMYLHWYKEGGLHNIVRFHLPAVVPEAVPRAAPKGRLILKTTFWEVIRGCS